jgi:hypothetical protein
LLPACGRISEDKIIAEVGFILIRDKLSLGFLTLLMGGPIMEPAIETTVEVGITVRAYICAGNRPSNLHGLPTAKTYFHGLSPNECSVRFYTGRCPTPNVKLGATHLLFIGHGAERE